MTEKKRYCFPLYTPHQRECLYISVGRCSALEGQTHSHSCLFSVFFQGRFPLIILPPWFLSHCLLFCYQRNAVSFFHYLSFNVMIHSFQMKKILNSKSFRIFHVLCALCMSRCFLRKHFVISKSEHIQFLMH